MHTSGDQGYRSPSLATPTNLGPGTGDVRNLWVSPTHNVTNRELLQRLPASVVHQPHGGQESPRPLHCLVSSTGSWKRFLRWMPRWHQSSIISCGDGLWCVVLCDRGDSPLHRNAAPAMSQSGLCTWVLWLRKMAVVFYVDEVDQEGEDTACVVLLKCKRAFN